MPSVGLYDAPTMPVRSSSGTMSCASRGSSIRVATRMLEPREAQDIVPELDLTGIVGASYNPTDGILFPWPFLWGYARQAAAHGVEVFTQTPVGGLEPVAGGGYVVRTP